MVSDMRFSLTEIVAWKGNAVLLLQAKKNSSLITHLEFLSVMFWSINNYLKLHYV